jgi:hypothetical protein
MTDKCHGLPITLMHGLLTLYVEGGCGHCEIVLLDTWIAGRAFFNKSSTFVLAVRVANGRSG